jgi:cytochrome P450
MADASATDRLIPEHVPAERVHIFDLYNVPGSDTDVQAALGRLHAEAPDIFWTPCNGGHWVATRAEHIRAMQLDYRHFSHRSILIPRPPEGTPRQIPLELDPPEHSQYRRTLTQALMPAIVREVEGKVYAVAVEAIERLKPLGRCEFVEDFAKILPIYVFLDLVDLPREDKDRLLPIAEKSVRGSTHEVRTEAHHALAAYLQPHLVARRENPGMDLLSKIVNTEVNGERIDFAEAMSFASLVLFGGLDTVAGMLGFFARHLAIQADHRRAITGRLDDEPFLNRVIEELLRRHGLANTARYVAEDYEFGGVRLKQGDAIMPINLLVGLDERVNPDPLTVDFDREKPVHAVFGNGAHACPGAILARRELRIFLTEWLSRIPDFALDPESPPVLATGMVNGVLRLDLVWNA